MAVMLISWGQRVAHVSQMAQSQMRDEEEQRRRQLMLQLAGMFMGVGQTGMGQAFQSTQSQMPQFGGGGGIFGI